jgi:RNA polymerase sigma factor (sigma-70 family)
MKRAVFRRPQQSSHESLPRFEDTYALIRCAAGVRLAAAAKLTIITPADREDLAQELAMAAWRALRHYDSTRAGLRTFLDKVVANRFASLMRARRSQPRLEPLQDHLPAGLDGIPAVEFRADFQRVSGLLAETDCRLASYLMNHSPTQASRAFGIARSTIYQRLRRIRLAFENGGFGSPARRVP